MSSGLQLPGAPSYASRLRGEAPPHKSSRIGKSGGMPPPKPPSALQNMNNNANMSSNTGKYLPSTPSSLGMYSQAHTKTQKPVTTDRRLPSDDSGKDNAAVRTKSRLPEDGSWKNDAASTVQTKSRLSRLPEDGSWRDVSAKDQNIAVSSKEELRPRPDGQQGIVDSMASLSISPSKKAEPMPVGRCLDWERPVFTSSASSKVSNYLPRSDRDHPKPTPSAYSISYKRRYNQTPMEKATYREYLPFLKSEFKVGMIIRMNIHESDFKGTSKAAIAQASQASTLVDGGRGDKRRKEHRHHGDFGPIYSENRIFFVVNVAEDVFTAIPLFTHEGKGLANVLDKKSWVSVEDHRQLGKCVQQSEHQPLRTVFLSPECDKLDPVSAAWIPYALPCRYDVPVAYQGKLDKASARRLVRLHRESWIDEESYED